MFTLRVEAVAHNLGRVVPKEGIIEQVWRDTFHYYAAPNQIFTVTAVAPLVAINLQRRFAAIQI
jgi:hypothetical protein